MIYETIMKRTKREIIIPIANLPLPFGAIHADEKAKANPDIILLNIHAIMLESVISFELKDPQSNPEVTVFSIFA